MFCFKKGLIWISRSAGRNGKQVRTYSRKTDSKNLGVFKVVNSDVKEDDNDSGLRPFPNWELFGPRGQRFLLPGNVGPAWHESGSMAPFDGFKNKSANFDLEALECIAQECPILLKDAIREMFPGSDSSGSQVTVITLSRNKFSSKKHDSEYQAKTFMWAAQEICLQLKIAGYWADFINPFSGRPYMSPLHSSTLYEAHEKFRCIGFEITKFGETKVIQTTSGKEFVGSLFTNAPPSTEFLRDLLTENE